MRSQPWTDIGIVSLKQQYPGAAIPLTPVHDSQDVLPIFLPVGGAVAQNEGADDAPAERDFHGLIEETSLVWVVMCPFLLFNIRFDLLCGERLGQVTDAVHGQERRKTLCGDGAHGIGIVKKSEAI